MMFPAAHRLVPATLFTDSAWLALGFVPRQDLNEQIGHYLADVPDASDAELVEAISDYALAAVYGTD